MLLKTLKRIKTLYLKFVTTFWHAQRGDWSFNSKNVAPVKFLGFVYMFLFCYQLSAQPEYTMTDTLVTDCEGFLTDSELGDVPGTYDHNENYTFTVCPDEADFILLSFSEFCTEFLFDSLRIYDGPDTLSTLIGGPYLGEIDPPQLTATSGCLTFNFISDPSVTCTGWTAFWTTDFVIPEPPVISPLADLECESNQITLEFDRNIHCDSLYAGAFMINGPQFPNIISTTPNNCVNDSTSSVTLTFAPPIDFAGNYSVFFTQNIAACENVYVLQAIGNFAVVNCPLNVIIEIDGEAACAGDATLLIAQASGGDPLTYSYAWSPISSDTSFLEIGVFGTTTYYVTVSDASGAIATDSLTVAPEPLPTFSIPDTTLCQSDTAFTLMALPAGGEWFGEGVLEEDTGLYDPGATEAVRDTILYIATNGCENELFIDFIALDEGSDDAACFGIDSFLVSGGMPLGGVWSGENINNEGVFFPPDTMSSFQVTYTHPNGCAGSKWVNIDTLVLPQIDSLCQSDEGFQIPVTPFGGTWAGAGIVNEDTGLFLPSVANQGDNLLTYSVAGCSESITVHIKEIDALDDFSACPEQDIFIIPGEWTPQGGIWEGIGILDPLTGLYDPSLVPNARDTMTYSVNGCVDERIVFVLQTKIDSEVENYDFCSDDEPVDLSVRRPYVFPILGIWEGEGVEQFDEEEFTFDPSLAGVGTHTIYYSINTCSDSITMVVHPDPVIDEVTICEEEGVVALTVEPAGGEWSGEGIINPFGGVFDAGLVGVGVYDMTNISDQGCIGTGQITVEEGYDAQINNIENYYCSTGQVIDLGLSPANGVFSVNDSIYPNFIPAQFSEGSYELSYTAGTGVCADTETFTVTIGAPIEMDLPFEADSLCYDQGLTLSATATGGSSLGNFTYTWSQGLGFGQSHLVQPLVDTEYVVTVSDGCSDSVLDTITIAVAPPIFVDFETQNPVCFDEQTSAEIFASPGENYTFLWSTIPVTTGDFIESYPTSYTVTVTDNDSGCFTTELIDLPGYDLLQANFGLSPNAECLTTINPTVQILDFSIGATTGYWLLGDSTNVEPYREGENLEYTFPDTGQYIITLHLENEGGCISEYQMEVCVEAEHTLFAPNAFTPNGDGTNDKFGFVGTNIEQVQWQIYNRYGHLIYEANDLDARWNGKFKGQRVQDGAYTYFVKYKALGDAQEREMTGMVLVLK